MFQGQILFPVRPWCEPIMLVKLLMRINFTSWLSLFWRRTKPPGQCHAITSCQFGALLVKTSTNQDEKKSWISGSLWKTALSLSLTSQSGSIFNSTIHNPTTHFLGGPEFSSLVRSRDHRSLGFRNWPVVLDSSQDYLALLWMHPKTTPIHLLLDPKLWITTCIFVLWGKKSQKRSRQTSLNLEPLLHLGGERLNWSSRDSWMANHIGLDESNSHGGAS